MGILKSHSILHMPPIYASESSNDPASYYFGSIFYFGFSNQNFGRECGSGKFCYFRYLIIANHNYKVSHSTKDSHRFRMGEF